LKKYISTFYVVILLTTITIGIPISHPSAAHASPIIGLHYHNDKKKDSSAATHVSTSASSGVSTASHIAYTPACAQVPAGYARCLAMVSTTNVQPTFAKALVHAHTPTNGVTTNAVANPTGTAAPYGPLALHNAYNLPWISAIPQTIAIIAAFDDPKAEADLATYRSTFGLSACTTVNGCFRKVDQAGGLAYPPADSGWGTEISLDLDMASAICQNCSLLLVEANTPSLTNLGAATNEAAALGATEISNSYGMSEFTTENEVCATYYDHPGIAITASSGDAGLGVQFPSACPDVTGVGGTTLNTDGEETTWSTSESEGAGGGCSAQVALPFWETPTETSCATRATSDVSAVADPHTGVYVYDTFGQGGGLQIGGTSASAPIIAATYALAGGTAAHTSAAIVPWLRQKDCCLNTINDTSYTFQSGLGSPNGLSCF
jgi:subtilase family serine protease